MKEPYGEGLANHAGPESCGDTRERGIEALTGVGTGRVMSRERQIKLRGADTVEWCGRPHSEHRKGEMLWDPARSKTPGMYRNTLRENRESHGLSTVDGTGERIGKSKDSHR
jgi:RNA-directed DNA polymerase